jgi:ABC-type nitrate/sulfonate/bicarbonate transport system ATPase subunit
MANSCKQHQLEVYISYGTNKVSTIFCRTGLLILLMDEPFGSLDA